jgi:hypothetical protein
MPKPPDSIRLVPRDPDPEEVKELERKHGWKPTDKSSGELPQWTLPDADAKVSWVDDPTTNVEFFVIEGPERQKAADQIEAGIDILHVEDFEDYLKRFHGFDGLMRGLQAVALAAPDECDRRVFDLLERHLSDDDPMVRRAALLAVGITGWQEFVEPLKRMRDDPDQQVQEDVGPALEALRDKA